MRTENRRGKSFEGVQLPDKKGWIHPATMVPCKFSHGDIERIYEANGGLVAHNDGADNVPIKIIEKLAEKVAKRYPSVRFVIYGKTQFDIDEGNYCPGGVVIYPPTWYHDFRIDFKNKKLTYQMSDDYESLYDARDDVEEGTDFEGCGPLSKDVLGII